MRAEKITGPKDIETVVNQYLSIGDGGLFEVDNVRAMQRMFSNISQKTNFTRIIKNNDGEIIGGIFAIPQPILYSKAIGLKQEFYYSIETGFSAARAVKVAHKALIEEANRRKLDFAMSCCSHLDEDRVLCKILAKQGWEIKGHLAVYHLTNYRYGD
jgi:hypothetical protein